MIFGLDAASLAHTLREAQRLALLRRMDRARERQQRAMAAHRAAYNADAIEGECERVADPLELPAPEGESW